MNTLIHAGRHHFEGELGSAMLTVVLHKTTISPALGFRPESTSGLYLGTCGMGFVVERRWAMQANQPDPTTFGGNPSM